MKVPIESSLLAALVAGFTVGVRHDATTDAAAAGSLTDHLMPTSHTLGDVQQKLADLAKGITGEPHPALMNEINALLGTPDHTNAGTSPIAP